MYLWGASPEGVYFHLEFVDCLMQVSIGLKVAVPERFLWSQMD
jgi:hypothetical protein